MSVEIKKSERVRLTGKNIEVNFKDISGHFYTYSLSVDKLLGEGASCICYEVTVVREAGTTGQKRVLKQFYPSPKSYEIDTHLDGIRLSIEGYSDNLDESFCPEVTKLGRKFEDAFASQVRLANEQDMCGLIVRPDLCYFDGATKYVLYEADFGSTLNFSGIDSVELLTEQMLGLAKALEGLHTHGFLYMDLKPENILVSNDGRVKVFDFDALINLEDVDSIHLNNGDVRYDGTNLNLIAPEIRPGNLDNFEFKKYLYLKPRIDIYSFGAILLSYFLNRYPTEEDRTAKKFCDEIYDMFEGGRRRGELTEEEQHTLCEIIWRCIQDDIGPRGRINRACVLVDMLQDFLKKISAPPEKRRRLYSRVNGRLVAAGVLDGAPLCSYMVRGEDGRDIMECTVVGEDSVLEDIVSGVLSSAHMTDTGLVIRRYLMNAEDRLYHLMEAWPLLGKITEIYLEDERIEVSDDGCVVALDERITSSPIAQVRFYEWDGVEPLSDLRWIVIAGVNDSEDIEIAEKVIKSSPDFKGKRFIAYLDERGDGFNMRRIENRQSETVVQPFSVNSKITLKEKLFKKGLNRKAFLLHKYYAREWNESLSERELWDDFKNGEYNIRSSICSVLSIPYKLKCAGIESTDIEGALEFRDKVLSGSGSRDLADSLLALEHRRWIGFMMTQGYDRPENYESYAYSGKNDRRNFTEKLHPCICECSGNGLKLNLFSYRMWDEYDVSKNVAGLDRLDIFSIEFHQFCRRRTAEMRAEGVFRNALSSLERCIDAENPRKEVWDAFRTVSSVLYALIDSHVNMNRRWNLALENLEEECRREAAEDGLKSGGIFEAIAGLRSVTRIVCERNLYHDYKASVRTGLKIIPLLMAETDGIKRVCKICTGNLWADVVSSIVLEPEELVLFSSGSTDPEQVWDFLFKKRGLAIKRVIVRDMEELGRSGYSSNSKRTVFDLTGVDEAVRKRVISIGNISRMPIVYFENGQLRCSDKKSAASLYSSVRRHLSVDEALYLKGITGVQEESQSVSLAMACDYKKLWKAVCSLGGASYEELTAAFAKNDEGNRYPLRGVPAGEYSPEEFYGNLFEQSNTPERMITDSGIRCVCESLASLGYIKADYILPGAGQVGRVRIEAASKEVLEILSVMFDLAERQPYRHRFELITYGSESIINDDTLLFECSLSSDVANVVRDRLGFAIEINQISNLEGTSVISGSYANHAVKSCLTDSLTLGRTMVYHSLWNNLMVDDIKIGINLGGENGGIDIAYVKDMQLYLIDSAQMATAGGRN